MLNDRYWLTKYKLMPRGAMTVADLPLDDYYWWPLIDRAEHEASRRKQASEQRRNRRGGA